MIRHAIRNTLLAALMLTFAASSARANNWQTQVEQAGGFWSPKLDAAGWNQKIFAPTATQVLGTLPQGVQTMLQAEVVDNPWIKGHEEMQTKLGNFRPEARQVFDLPYIPIPADQMKFKYESSGMSDTMKQNVTFTKDGQRFVRYFFHPLYADKYKELIETYGVKYGEYQAASTSSPRSLVVWQKNQPNKPIWVKVSIHANLDYYTKRDANGQEKKIGISRVQTEKKARRSALVNAAFNSAGRTELAKQRVDYMAEPASFVPGDIQYQGRRLGFDRATIFREIPEGLTAANPETRYVPAFTFIKEMKPTLERINAERATAGKQPVNAVGWMTKGLIEPLIRTYIHLGMEHGLEGELHTQNFLLEVDKKGIPTGKLMVKDLDGFRMDLDMRIRNNRSISFLNHFTNPFEWAKHSATQGSSANPAVLQGWFNKLIRNVNGFTTTRTVNGVTEKVYSTPAGQLMVQLQQDFPDVMRKLEQAAVKRDPTLQGNAEKTTQKAVEQVFDLVAKAQFRRITGVTIDKANWGYGQDKGLNNGLNTLRTELFRAQPGLGASINAAGRIEANAQAQGILASTFNRLRTPTERKADERTWLNGTPKTFRYLGDGVIEGISRGGKPVGYAILKPDGVNQLHGELQRAGLQIPTRTRAQGHLKDYSAQDQSSKRPFDSWLNGRRPSSDAATLRPATSSRRSFDASRRISGRAR